MSAWDLPYLAVLALGAWALVTDGRGLGAIERALGFFGVGRIGAREALFHLFAVAALAGLGFHALALRRFGALEPALFLLGFASALGIGVAAVWLRARIGRGAPTMRPPEDG